MKKNISILQGVTERHYHVIPSEIGMITLPPEREAIISHLARIGYSRFPEFVSDILRLVEKHTDIQITDGPGDETQDILSLTPTGERHLTQCKHTIDLKQHCAGSELDALFAACHRKDCREGLLATNTDLTPQAKRYVTDREFARLAERTGAAPVKLNYWNNTRIWERIATSSSILSKWFGGMGQTHGLRRFWFYLIIHRMPGGQSHTARVDDFKALGKSAQVSDDGQLQVTLNADVTFTVQEWFARDLDLGVNFIGPETEHRQVNIPIAALKVHVTVVDGIGQYQPSVHRDLIVKFIGDTILPKVRSDEWWHLVATTPQTFVFLQDIQESKVISISEAESFVRIGDQPTGIEKHWIFPGTSEYERLSEGSEDADLRWRHVPSDTTITLILLQRPHPVAAYEHFVRQSGLVKRLECYEFRALQKPTSEEFDRIRRLLIDPRWILMKADDGDLFWAFPPAVPTAEIRRMDELLIGEGIKVLRVAKKDRTKIVKWIDVTPEGESWLMNNSESDMSVPVALHQRMVWLTREFMCAAPSKIATWFELLKFKSQYEARHGFDFMQGQKTQRMSSAEIQPFLFDLLTVRGSRMVDVVFVERTLTIHLRLRIENLCSMDEILLGHISEFDRIATELLALLIEK